MCGIIGYVGAGNALPALLNRMHRLEYRGYDSAGVAVVSGGRLTTVRRAGHLQKLVDEVEKIPIQGSAGIGHTRWATHGAPTDANAHPHRDCTGRLAIVHNGIIENHEALRTRLESEGHELSSETDSEVVAHLIESILKRRSCSLRTAVLEAVNVLEGAFALVCLSADHPDRIIAARQEAPIIVGSAPGAGLVASGIPALLDHTRVVVPLENRQVAEVEADELRVFDFGGVELTPESVTVEWDREAAEKGGYEGFMRKEIHEQPQALRDTMLDRFRNDGRVRLDEVR